MQAWEFAEVTVDVTISTLLGSSESEEEVAGTVVFSGAQETIDFGEGELWDTLHQLGLVHPAWIFVPMGILAFGQGMALPNINASAVSLAPQNAGLASSIVGFTQQIVGAVCVQWIGTYPVDTPLPMLIFCAVASIFALVVLRTFMQRR